MNTPRKLTVGEVLQGPGRLSFSSLRLIGQWLRQAGFLPGTAVTVTIEPDRLVIEKASQNKSSCE